MRSPRYRISLPPLLAAQLDDVAEASGQARSAIIRRCVEMALGSPELLILLHQHGPPVLTDTRTEEQIAAWERYQQQAFDPATILT
jgi:hypothetical protein